ncbi:MAG: hypothetical protein IPM64_17770 [Phycisphaerales bacterium]|nr:hypothetical protein [Phycisphaerales bacterium]
MSWMRRAFKLFELMDRHGRELERKDLELRLGMNPLTATKVLLRLSRAGCIRREYGNTRTGVFYSYIAGSKLPEDTRGRAEASRSALRRAAARPISGHADKITKAS